jgi:hypothetical protein
MPAAPCPSWPSASPAWRCGPNTRRRCPTACSPSGSDYPFAPEATLAASVKALNEMGLAPDTLSGIERGHALKLFPQFG